MYLRVVIIKFARRREDGVRAIGRMLFLLSHFFPTLLPDCDSLHLAAQQWVLKWKHAIEKIAGRFPLLAANRYSRATLPNPRRRSERDSALILARYPTRSQPTVCPTRFRPCANIVSGIALSERGELTEGQAASNDLHKHFPEDSNS